MARRSLPGSTAACSVSSASELDAGDDSFLDTIASYQAGFSWLRRPEFISVAAVQGHAVGAGFQLALACDLRIAASDAQFRMAEPSLGLVPDLGGTQVLVDLVGYSRALEICATNRSVGAEEADRMGLVNLCVAVRRAQRRGRRPHGRTHLDSARRGDDDEGAAARLA